MPWTFWKAWHAAVAALKPEDRNPILTPGMKRTELGRLMDEFGFDADKHACCRSKLLGLLPTEGPSSA